MLMDSVSSHPLTVLVPRVKIDPTEVLLATLLDAYDGLSSSAVCMESFIFAILVVSVAVACTYVFPRT